MRMVQAARRVERTQRIREGAEGTGKGEPEGMEPELAEWHTGISGAAERLEEIGFRF